MVRIPRGAMKQIEPDDTDGQPVRVLVVDDQHDTADALAQLLHLLGYGTLVAYDGDAAVAAALEHRPAAVILDLHMPALGGVVACTRIRQQPGGGAMRLVALTGSTDARDREAADLAGFDHFLVKPLMLGALLRVLPPVHAPKVQ
jgi:CheY-like chemotaxis protein